jgi:hypothetical protein
LVPFAAGTWQRIDGRLGPRSGRVRSDAFFDETQSLVEPIERRDMDGSAGRSEAGAGASRTGVTPLLRASVPPVSSEGRASRMRRTPVHGSTGSPQRSRMRIVAEPNGSTRRRSWGSQFLGAGVSPSLKTDAQPSKSTGSTFDDRSRGRIALGSKSKPGIKMLSKCVAVC